MNRRSLLKTLLGGSAALVLDPERLLWVPGAKTIFIPKTQIPITFVDVFQGTIGICDGIPIPLQAVNTDTMGPLFEDGVSIYRLVELKPNTHIHWGPSTIFAVPGGKLQVLVRGPSPLRGPIMSHQPGGIWL